jgi:hypothetical protein
MIRANTLHELQGRLTAALDVKAGQLASGAISTFDFYTQAEELIRLAHSRAAVLGTLRARRHNPPTNIAIRVAGRAADEQRAFLLKFTDDLVAGKYRPKAQDGKGATARKRRFALYSMRLAGTANTAWLETLRATQGSLEVLWVLGSAREHCATCTGEASIGWREASTLTRVPGDGTSICVVRCRCRLRTREGAESYAL